MSSFINHQNRNPLLDKSKTRSEARLEKDPRIYSCQIDIATKRYSEEEIPH